MGSDGNAKDDEVFGYQISIHAPRMGSDLTAQFELQRQKVFQSTLPAWGATSAQFIEDNPPVFQSTLPAWGATIGPKHTAMTA